ncbi:GRRM system radical SAM/SPASM domain protein [Phormidium sp. LEGE 05292]|uniref:cyclophane-forming radical SAM/SPASM peptide maturase GrrM/OscB n=1 Tax=[Phormidium] sp. LEGE 05292 TaxID=767427 RepID=UPI00187DE6E4|nr:cyclophane-forming radical SAM/SPASM peptide maturase GrrM/OscB [Phormidium sp. LEGE 05292]MBE9224538.1 GRRM system radical SAM/SPASM domain protein [Phormidium sp. LEGE 05292]
MTISNAEPFIKAKNELESGAKVNDFSAFGPINLIVLQPTSFCNLDCDYCYLPDRQVKQQLSLNLVEPIFKTIFTSQFFCQDATVCWHAGEPLAVPISFYEAVFQQIDAADRQYNITPYKIRQSIQTNATLINQAWCDLFKQYNVHVGVSIDGPAFLHDAHRKTRKGLGTHAATMRGISYLQKNNFECSAIAVLTEDSLEYPDEIFHFFKDNGITDVGFNMEETEGKHQSSLDHKGIEDRYRAFIQRFWELVTQSNGEFKLREFETICSLIYRDSRLQNTDMNKPFVIVNIDSKGNFATFDPELLSVQTDRYGKFILGNVLEDTFESVCSSEKFQQMYGDMSAGVALCHQNCPYFGLCGGGAGSNKYWENGTFNSSETKACRYRIKAIADVVLEGLESSMGF